MKLATMIAFSAAAVSASSVYDCLKTSELVQEVPVCAKKCQIFALSNDGCPYEDLTCHCTKATQVIEDLIVPCFETKSNCTQAELGRTCSYVNNALDVSSQVGQSSSISSTPCVPT